MLRNIISSIPKIEQGISDQAVQRIGNRLTIGCDYTEFLVEEALEDEKRGINSTHIYQEFILMGILVGQGYTPQQAYETVEAWEKTGESKLLQASKKMNNQ